MTAKSADFDSTYFRSALGRFATGVTVITCESPLTGEPLGLTISSFTSVSLAPPLVLWTLIKSASSLPHFQKTERYVIHVLAASQLHLAKRFARGSQPERFQGIKHTQTVSGTLKLAEPDCPAWFECFNLAQHDAGDHIVFVGQVEHCQRNFNQPLVYHAGDFDLTPSTEPLSSI